MKMTRMLRVMILDPQMTTISITCKCGNRWIETDVPKEISKINAVLVFDCPRCGQEYGHFKGRLARMLADGQPDMSTLIDALPKPTQSGGNA